MAQPGGILQNGAVSLKWTFGNLDTGQRAGFMDILFTILKTDNRLKCCSLAYSN